MNLSFQVSAITNKDVLSVADNYQTWTEIHHWQNLKWAQVHQHPCIKIFDKDILVGYAVVEIHRLNKVSIWMGPVHKKTIPLEKVMDCLLEACAKEKYREVNYQPLNATQAGALDKALDKISNIKTSTKLGWATGIKKLETTNDLLLKSFSENHRRSLKKGIKLALEVKKIESIKETKTVLDLFHLMYKQRNIHFYKKQLDKKIVNELKFVIDENGGFAVGVYKEEKLVGVIILHTNKVASFYIYGASDQSIKEPIMHLAFLEGMNQTNKLGLQYFDFGGYERSERDDPQFSKINQFKAGFGVDVIVYPDQTNIYFNKYNALLLNAVTKSRNAILKLKGKHFTK